MTRVPVAVPLVLALAIATALSFAIAAAPAQAAAAAGKRAPSRPPLETGTGNAGSRVSAEEEASSSAAPSGGDPLQSNGLNSPLCSDASGELPGGALRDCRSSGFEGELAPTGDYGLDVHIGTSITDLGGYAAVIIENILQLWWTMLVAVVRGVIVILDWCYAIDLLNSPAMSGVAHGLRETQRTFTQPWLVIVLAVASVLALYHGLIRRRVAETVGEALLMMAMMVGGLWVILNPTGTVGALGAWANEASLGTLAAAAGRSPDHPDRTFAESNRELFRAAIDAPWCFIEFGNVGWCEAPVEGRLHTAAMKLAAQARAGGEGVGGGSSLVHKALAVPVKIIEWGFGAGGQSEAPHVSLQSAALLRGARTNGELFLALPANGTARNSIGNEWSLFHVLCGRSEEPCSGSTAGEAEFRTQEGTWSRAIGLTLVAFGVLGMLLLLGFIGWHLLFAAFMSLIYLLLTPAAVLLPALGEGGRSAFRTWVLRLLGAVTSKLIYSFLLGAVLMVQRVLGSAHLFGWLIQWLMLSSLWWIVYLRRHRLFDLVHGASSGRGESRSVVRRVSNALESRKGMAATRWAKRRLSQPGPSVERRRRLAQAGRERAQQIADAQVDRGLGHKYREAGKLVAEGDAAQARISAKRRRLDGIKAKHVAALAAVAEAKSAHDAALVDQSLFSPLERNHAATNHGARELAHRKRAASLQHRMGVLQAEIDRDQGALTAARQNVKGGERAKRATSKPYTLAQAAEHGRYLDAQAALPRGERDYAGMAGVADLTGWDYERLDPRSQREARLQIDRELAKRSEMSGAVADMAARAGGGSVGWRDKRQGSKELESRIGGSAHAPIRRPPNGPGPGRRGLEDGPEATRNQGAARTAHVRTRRRGSPVLDDAREVAARRKRQLGGDRP
jgi:hypothetical protein